MSIRLIMLGDIVGRSGRLAVMQQIPELRKRFAPTLIIVNAENAANGSGLTPEHYRKLCDAGVDAITLGDHVYRKQQIVATLEQQPNIIRPANLPAGAKGKPWMQLATNAEAAGPPVYVMTLLGRLFMNLQVDDPFATVDRILTQIGQRDAIILVEVHAEATSEKQALAWYLNGRVSAVVGTHTHVATADARILATNPQHGPRAARTTAFISDLGMSGPQESILGRRIDRVLTHMTTAMPSPFDVAEGDPRVCGVCIDIDPGTGSATAIERIELKADPTKPPFVAAR
jgi:metallophosphoesterase (TIGR00282 family)